MSLAIPLTLTRRALRGAAYPSWSLSFEMQHELGRTLLRNHHSFSLADLCQLSADFASDPPAGQCSVRGAYCAGIKADIIQHRSSKAASSQQNLAHNQKKSHHTQKKSNRRSPGFIFISRFPDVDEFLDEEDEEGDLKE